MIETILDRAWRLANAPLAGDAGMARFYDVFAGCELFLIIDADSLDGDGPPQPALFPVDGARTALIFDSAERLADFMPGGAHLTLSGRAAIAMFAGKDVQLAVNLGEAPSATILPAEAVDWAAQALRQPIETVEETAGMFTVPRGVMPDLLAAIDGKLAALGATLAEAWLCGLGDGLVLCLLLREPGAEQAVVSALAETSRFSGGEAAAFDIAVMAADDPRLAAARKVGLGFEPAAPAPPVVERAAPGMDKDKPPILR